MFPQFSLINTQYDKGLPNRAKIMYLFNIKHLGDTILEVGLLKLVK